MFPPHLKMQPKMGLSLQFSLRTGISGNLLAFLLSQQKKFGIKDQQLTSLKPSKIDEN